MKPVIYQDVDGVLLQFPEWRTREWWQHYVIEGCVAAEGAKEYLEWITEHCEVRWATAWCTQGSMERYTAERLAKALDVSVELVMSINNDLGWNGDKTQCINWTEHEEGRSWIWVDDENSREEWEELERRGATNNLVKCNTSKYPYQLVHLLDELKGSYERHRKNDAMFRWITKWDILS